MRVVDGRLVDQVGTSDEDRRPQSSSGCDQRGTGAARRDVAKEALLRKNGEHNGDVA